MKLSEFVNVIQNVLPTEKTHFKRSNWSIQFSLPPILMIGGVIDQDETVLFLHNIQKNMAEHSKDDIYRVT